jgi:hypothetical protein
MEGQGIMAGSKRRVAPLALVMALFASMLAVFAGAADPVAASGVAFAQGDVMAAIGLGSVKHFDSSGTLLDTLTGASSTYTTGMAFDSAGNLYTTGFDGNVVSKYDTNGNFLGTFGSGFTSSPESIVFDAAGNAYVGEANAGSVRKFDASGNPLATYAVAVEDRGGDWIDLAADQCTLFYTSEGTLIKRFDVCTNTQLADFATLPQRPAFALRIRPNGEVMVATAGAAYRLDTSGTIQQTYTIPSSSTLFAMNLDSDGTSFWTGDIGTGEINRVDIATGNILTTFNSSPDTSLAGLAVVGEITAARTRTLTLSPASATNPVGGTHTVTATLTEDVDGVATPLPGWSVAFSVTSGPNTGATGTGTTDANGEATFTYSDTGGAGTDTIGATATPPTTGATVSAVEVTKTWIVVNQPPTCATAAADPSLLWPPNHKFRRIDVVGVTDADGDAIAITIDSIRQDEPTDGIADGATDVDARGVGRRFAKVRAERAGSPKVPGNGRVYHIGFTADDGNGGTCSGVVRVGVPHDQGRRSVPVDDGPLYDSTV